MYLYKFSENIFRSSISVHLLPPFSPLGFEKEILMEKCTKTCGLPDSVEVFSHILNVQCTLCTLYSSSQAFKKEMAGEIYVVSVDET